MSPSDLDLDDLAQQQAWEANRDKYIAWYWQVFGCWPEEEENHNEQQEQQS